MKKIITILALLALVAPAAAQMGSHLKEEFHDKEAYGIYMVDGVSGLRSALLKEDARVICFQSFNEELDDERRQELLDWVREGHTVWFYDARLAPKFGMKSVLFPSEAFRSKPEEGVLGGKKRKGLATTVVSLGAHAIQTGVGQVTVFLPRLESEDDEDDAEPLFGGVEVAGDTKALLQFTLDSPALVACRREGRGFIVFKSLLWNEPLSGDRFQMNLLEYSAGYEVPGPAGVGKVGNPPGPEAEYIQGDPAEPLDAPNAPIVLTAPDTKSETVAATQNNGEETKGKGAWLLELKDGKTLSGDLDVELVEFETGSSSLKLKPQDIESIVFGSAVRLDKMMTGSGQEKSGLLLTAPIRFRTEDGVEEFDKDDIVKLSRAQGVPEE
jgi:hypothetical protein